MGWVTQSDIDAGGVDAVSSMHVGAIMERLFVLHHLLFRNPALEERIGEAPFDTC